jgi:hypothetical protein
MSTHVSDLAAQHDADARDEAASDRAGVYVPDEVPPQPKRYCARCQNGTKAYVCGPCLREAS